MPGLALWSQRKIRSKSSTFPAMPASHAQPKEASPQLHGSCVTQTNAHCRVSRRFCGCTLCSNSELTQKIKGTFDSENELTLCSSLAERVSMSQFANEKIHLRFRRWGRRDHYSFLKFICQLYLTFIIILISDMQHSG